jgi:DNA-binding transcriptional LysR family regulator
MNWNDLNAFLAVHREGTYAAAARHLGVNSTTVARRIDRLQDDIGAVLFQQSSDGLIPTAAAEAIVPAAVGMERQATLIERRMSGDEARLQGTVRIATATEFVTHFLLNHLGAFHTRYPHIELDFLIGNPFVSLSTGQADMAIRFARIGGGVPLSRGEPPDAVVGRFLTPTSIDLVASRDYIERRGMPDPDQGLAGHDIILQPDVNYLPGMDYLAQFEEEANVVFRCDSLAALMMGAQRGLGITAAPSYFSTQAFSDLVILRRGIDSRHAWLLMARDLRRVARVRAVHDFVVELFMQWGGVWAGDESAVPG